MSPICKTVEPLRSLYTTFSLLWKGRYNHYISFSPCFLKFCTILYSYALFLPLDIEMWRTTQTLLFMCEDCVWLNGCIKVSQNEDMQEHVWTLQHIYFVQWVCISNITHIHKNLPTCAHKIPIAVWHKVLEKDISVDTFWSNIICCIFN